ncbi:VWA domain-containing protein [Alteromonas sp. 5E99-2]|uniref:vWA domain-containing protein n=1 Tax=Alteromonas sp. 5E99-2 TaxID=2817683 RepID=UPI001A998A64|nr:VWA domain-containing protein [Alteromonas sp. 5E99-2]MBO1256081.1 VWA domain-containing protein [Alteromonas sp. 5E99-2]
MFSFEWVWVFAALPIPVLCRWLLPTLSSQSQSLTVPFHLSSELSAPATNNKTHIFSQLVLWVIWILFLTAAARPQWLGDPITVPSEGREMILAVDLSGSMQIEDMELNGRTVDRLTMVKSVLSDFVERRVGDRLGLILFADTAYLQAPMTFDRKTVFTLLQEAVIGLIGEKTAIGDAIGLAVKRFRNKEESNNVLVLLTDGQNTAGNISPEEANQLAIEQNVKIYTIGIGADSLRVSSLFGSRQVNPSRDLDEKLLSELAKSTGGQYFRAHNAQELETIYTLLDQLEPIEGDGQTYRPLHSLFLYPLLAALALLFLLSLSQVYWLGMRNVK